MTILGPRAAQNVENEHNPTKPHTKPNWIAFSGFQRNALYGNVLPRSP